MSFDIGSTLKSVVGRVFKGARNMCGYSGSYSDLEDISASQKKDDGERLQLLIKKSTEKVFTLIKEFESKRLEEPTCQPYAKMVADTRDLSSSLADCLKKVPLENLDPEEKKGLSMKLEALAASSSYTQDALLEDFENIKSEVNPSRAKVIGELVDSILICVQN